MSRLLVSILIIYMLIFTSGCQTAAKTNLNVTPVPAASEAATKEASNTGTFSAGNNPHINPYKKDAKNTLKTKDLQLGGIKLKMNASDAEKIIGYEPSHIIQGQNGVQENRFYDDIELDIQNNEIIYISATSDKYATPKGLKVGDSVEKLLKLYGTPAKIYNNIYSYEIYEGYYSFHTEVKDGKITRIQVNLAP